MDYHQISEQDPLLASLTRHTNPSQSQMETSRAGLPLRIYWNAIQSVLKCLKKISLEVQTRIWL